LVQIIGGQRGCGNALHDGLDSVFSDCTGLLHRDELLPWEIRDISGLPLCIYREQVEEFTMKVEEVRVRTKHLRFVERWARQCEWMVVVNA
jgi:hypothetical protein